ncbi:MAG: TMEM43 family protein [Muribaculaceae bacterium]|nr:TMEM43 family protein [Muribaculaceae bacterium]
MAYTTRTTNSYGSRVSNSFKNILTGIVVFIAGTALLWWNEGNFVKTQKMLEEAQGAAVHVESVAKVDPANEGQLIHACDKAITTDSLVDDKFGVSATAIKISRKVEYYQWVEHKKEERRDKVGGGEEVITTYTYSKEWVSSPTNSASFEDPEYRGIKNDVLMEVEDGSVYAQTVNFGGYKLSEDLIKSVGGDVALTVNTPEDFLKNLDKDLSRNSKNESADENGFNLVHVNSNVIYLGESANGNQIGDVRVTFTYVPSNQAISVIAKVQGDTFTKYVAKNGRKFDRLEMGTKSMDEMFQSANDENSAMTWGLRILGIILVIIGLKLTFEFLTTLLKVLPFLANIMNFGVSLICTVVGFVWSLIIIAIAWLYYRPLIGCIILAAVVGIIYYFSTKGKKKEPALAPEAPQTPELPKQ